MSAVPRFGGGGAKCKNCATTVYANEKIDYDGQTYHASCFKCTECKSTIGLTAVAMIDGVLYCKNCFKRIFTREGKYSSFDAKGPRGSVVNENGGSNVPASGAAAATSPAASTERRASVVLPCVVAECKGARVARKSYCLEHLSTAGATVEASAASVDLLDAITLKNVDKVKDILSRESTTAIVFAAGPKGLTPLEAAFTGIQNSRACGEAILAWLQTKVQALESAAGAAAASPKSE